MTNVFFVVINLQQLTATSHCGELWDTLHTGSKHFKPVQEGRKNEGTSKAFTASSPYVNSLHLTAMFHPGFFGDLPCSLREHNVQQQIFVPSVSLPPYQKPEASVKYRTAALLIVGFWHRLAQDSTIEEAFLLPHVFNLELVERSSLPTVPARGISCERVISYKLQNVPLCSLIPWKCVSQHNVYHLF